MNYRIILNVLGKTMIVVGLLMLLPFVVGLIYGEMLFLEFLVPIAIFEVVGFLFTLFKKGESTIRQKEGLFIVAFTWIVFSLIGCLPFVLGGYVPNYVDAFFETVSGVTTTGATNILVVDILPKGIMFWRMFTHWIGGMGVLVFVMALIPNATGVMHVFRAESPGPTVGKFVGKVKITARILYGIYISLTVLQTIFLLFGGMPLYDSILYAFSTAGTGGFAITNSGVGGYNSVYIEMVFAVFMMLYGTNFTVFYLIIIGNFSKAFKNEELWVYYSIVIGSTLIIAINTLTVYANFFESFRYAYFQVTSIASSTGLTTVNSFDEWPEISKTIILFLSIVGASAGSTGGGIKVSRMMILVKSSFADSKKLFHPNTIVKTMLDKEVVEDDTIRNVRLHFFLWIFIVVISTFVLSFDSFTDLFTNFSATIACIGNIGPGFGAISQNYCGYNWISKLMLSFDMLVGRLEIFPMLIFVFPKMWKPRKIK